MFFIITIDTEGDNQWARTRTVTTENAAYLDRFQQLCESYGFKPTYLTDYDMARSDRFVEFGRRVMQKGTAEIGMHLHAWNTPPLQPLTEDDDKHHPYLIEYPMELIRDKVALMTDLLEKTFGRQMRSHRAGRWAFNHVYARVLAEHGYVVDCSVTPHISWRSKPGDPGGEGGVDYRGFPERAYFVDADDISRPGASTLLEVPLTVMPCRSPMVDRLRDRFGARSVPRRALDRFFPAHSRFRPTRNNLPQMKSVLAWARARRMDYVEFMLHSSELMPGGSPTFRTPEEIEQLYSDMNELFSLASGWCRGATLTEFHDWFVSRHRTESAGAA